MPEKENKEDKNKKKAIVISLISHALLVLLFFMIAAWTEPDPPIPEYGIELSFLGQASSTSTAQKTPVNSESEEKVIENTDVNQTENQENSKEEVVENADELESTNSTEEIPTEDLNSPNQVEEISDADSNEQEAAQVEDSEANQINEEQSEVESEKETGVKEKEIEVVDKIEPEPEPSPELDDRALFKGKSDTKNEAGGGSNASGSSLDMSGWIWDFKPEPDDKSTENGKIIFSIKVDGEGEIISITTLEKTVSPIVEKIYRNAVMELSFSKTFNNKSAATNSKGTITFIIQSK